MADQKPPANINSDDAAIFALNSPDDDETDDTEDPANRGSAPANKVDMFRTRPQKATKRTVHGGATPRPGGFQLTPGARKDPSVGPPGPKLA